MNPKQKVKLTEQQEVKLKQEVKLTKQQETKLKQEVQLAEQQETKLKQEVKLIEQLETKLKQGDMCKLSQVTFFLPLDIIESGSKSQYGAEC